MTSVTKLTAEQEARLAEFRDKWLAIGLCTDPADRPRAEKAIIESYKTARLLPPSKIVWCGSPLSQALTRAIFLDKSVCGDVVDSIAVSATARVRDSVTDSVWDSVADGVGATVRNTVWESVGAAIGDSISASAWVQVSIEDSVAEGVAVDIRDGLSKSVRDSVRKSVRDSANASLARRFTATVSPTSVVVSGYGQHDAAWISVQDYFREACGLIEQTEKLLGLMGLCKSAGWYLPHRHICWVSERHNFLARDERGRLHNLSGPAITYPDGWKIYAVHGVRVPGWVIENSETVTVQRIESEDNMEVRRVMIDRYGMRRYLVDSGAQIIHQDTFGVLYSKPVLNDEPIVMVKVRNSTPEPDGSVKEYFLRVPPEIGTARAAVAWTFGSQEKHYSPEIET